MKRVQLEIVLGTILVLLSVALVIILGVQEPQRLAQYEVQQRAEQIEFGASIYTPFCASCHGSQAQGVTGVAPSLRDEYFFTQRVKELGWSGSLEDYIVSVVTSGRPFSTRPELYGGATGRPPVMPTWSEKFGGPLRDDQIRAVAAFVMNFEPYALGQVATSIPLGPLADESTPEGRGQVVFNAAGCTACHTISGISTGIIGPVLDGLATRAATRVSSLTAEEYIRQSVLEPGAYLVESFADGVMPSNFGQVLTEEQISDLVAFLLTLE
ncbi:MAG TPA: c-type cytochrome [Anaerolineales bacterium]|nr:c-type cytochrome [Anaerolineales bacterium]HLE74304.1 c-type cytochrome [Anaerolineales bacterium]